MMDWTDRHCRFFHRLLTRHALLYTEMVTADAVHPRRPRAAAWLSIRREHPVALQLGGSDPRELAAGARIGADLGYDEINLNVGCPSDRVQDGRFGACLMREPELVGECVAAMKAAVAVPVTVKCRIGVDEQDPEEALDALRRAVVAAGGDALIVHARKAWLEGLVAAGRTATFRRSTTRACTGSRSGSATGRSSSTAASTESRRPKAHLAHVDGVMMGRAAYENPGQLLDANSAIFDVAPPAVDIQAALEKLFPYIENAMREGARLNSITRHLLGLFRGQPGARAFRRHLATEAVKPGASIAVLREALGLVLDRDRELAQTAA